MTRMTQIATPALVAIALAAGFYWGRTTAVIPAIEAATDAEENRREDSHGTENTILTLDPTAQARLGIQFAPVQTRHAQQVIETTGTVAANQTRMVHVRPPARGRIHEVYVRPGDRVRAGQPLLSYDNVELGEALGQYIAALTEIERSHFETDVARHALERAASLVDLGAVAKADLQRREARYRDALAETERRKAEAAQVEQKLHRFGMTDPEIRKLHPSQGSDYHREASHSVLTSPFAGVVTQFNVAPGESVDTAEELMTVCDLSVVWVQADIYEKDIRFVREGGAAEVRVGAYPDRVFTGRITYVADILDPETRTAKVRVEVPNPEGLLKVEMFASARIPTPTNRPALMVPSESIHRIDQRVVAFVKTGNGFEKRAVELGQQAGHWVEVTKGLDEGEVVVTEGSFLLKSEAKKADLGHHHED